MDQRIEFAIRSLSSTNFQELCRQYGISRKTGYKWRARFVEQGISGMEEESRRPHSNSKELSEQIVCEMVRLKQAHPHWGPRKIRALFERKHGQPVPCESSFKRVLERAGLTRPRRRRRAQEGGRLASGRKAKEANDVWTVDFKGWWRDREGLRVEPLTVRDEYSRMLLEMRVLESCRTEAVRHCFEGLFEENGLPKAIRSDNGPPFACGHALLGLSRLSVWWLALGIELERGRPGCPQDNGAHERLHRDIRRELQAGRIGRDQSAFDLWRREYNTQRPHEALGMQTPSEHYRSSERHFDGTPEELDYEGKETRKVQRAGHIVYGGDMIAISRALQGWDVGLAPREDGLVEVWFASQLLGHLDPTAASFLAAHPGATDPLRSDSATLHRPEEGIETSESNNTKL